MFKCINCGLCEESCPVDSIVVTPIHHYHIGERGQNIMTKEKLLAVGDLMETRLAADRLSDEKYR
jgi:NADH-quinone oxidoreductase subunit I